MNGRADACTGALQLLPELVLGILEARDRGLLLAHLEGCSTCGLEADHLALAADLLTELAPSIDPPAPLEGRVLGRRRPLRAGRRAIRSRRVAAVVAVAVTLAGLGVLAGRLSAPTQAQPSRQGGAARIPEALGAASGRFPVAALTADLRSSAGVVVGKVAVYGGRHPWLFVRLTGLDGRRMLGCEVRTTTGRVLDLGSFSTAAGSWTSALPVPAGSLRAAQVTSASGAVLARADLSW